MALTKLRQGNTSNGVENTTMNCESNQPPCYGHGLGKKMSHVLLCIIGTRADCVVQYHVIPYDTISYYTTIKVRLN